MRKLVLTAIVTVSIICTSFANGAQVNSFVKKQFAAEFREAKDVQWKSTDSFAEATFMLNDTKTQAFYEHSGDLIGTSRAINIELLPTYAKRIFAKQYSNYTVEAVIEFVKADESAYFISATRDGKEIILKIANGEVSMFR